MMVRNGRRELVVSGEPWRDEYAERPLFSGGASLARPQPAPPPTVAPSRTPEARKAYGERMDAYQRALAVERNRRYRAAHPEAHRAWAEANRVRINAYKRAWRAARKAMAS